MDSLTQIVLGAAVGEAVLGKKVGSKAMLWGAIAGTIPDLDVITKFFVDDLTANELHRGISHSLFFSVVFAPLLGYFIHWIYRKKSEATGKEWSLLAFWALVTHPLLDCHTTWGTQFLWPLPYKVAYNNIFVVDPLYTLPFLVLLISASLIRRDRPLRRKLNWTGIILSSTYMIWTLGAKTYVHYNFSQNLYNQQITYKRLTTVPSPFNSILWMGTAETDGGYKVGVYSLLDKTSIIEFRDVSGNHHLIDSIKDEKTIKRLKYLAKDWYIIERSNDQLKFIDMRFGPMLTKTGEAKYPFGYKLINSSEGLIAEQERPNPEEMDFKQVFADLFTRMKGK